MPLKTIIEKKLKEFEKKFIGIIFPGHFVELKSFLTKSIKEACQEMARAKLEKPKNWDRWSIERQIGFNQAVKQLKQNLKKFLNP